MGQSKISLIVGLGNPCSQYESTRHNVGQWFLHKLAEYCRVSFKLENKFKASVVKFTTGVGEGLLAIPTTYMNHSGQAVASIAKFYKMVPEQILVVHDELDLAVGTARFKFSGGHGGHNGLRDIISQLGSRDFYRLRIGIGHPGQSKDVSDYVLARPSLADREKIEDGFSKILQEFNLIHAGQFDLVMNRLH